MKKILFAVGIITAGLLSYIWFIARPEYEASVLAERLAAVQQLQKSSIDNIDHTIVDWSNIPRFIVSEITEKPSEGEAILQMMMALHPEIIQMRIHSSAHSDELMSRDTSYPLLNFQFTDSVWEHSKVDSALQIAWLNRTELPTLILAMQMHFQVHQIPFTLTVVWNAKRVNDILAGLPFDNNYSVSIHSSSGVIAQNSSTFKSEKIYVLLDTSDTVHVINEGTDSRRVLTSAFQSSRLWIAVTVSEKIFSKPVEDFLFYSALLTVVPMIIIALLGWLLSCQIKRFIKKLETPAGAAGDK